MLRELLIEIGIDIDNDPIKDLNEEINDLVKKLKKLDVDDIEDLDKHFKEIVESTEQVNKNLKKMNKGFKDVEKSARRLGRTTEDLSDDIRDADRRTEDFNDSLRDSERHAEDLSDGFRDADRQAGRLADSLEDAEREISSLVRETGRLDSAFRDVTQAASRITRELDSISFSGLQSEISRLENSFGGIVRAAQIASTEATEIGTSAAASVSDVGRLERAFERVEGTVDKINSGVDGIGSAAIGAAGAVGAGMGIQDIVDRSLASTSLDTKLSIATEVSPESQKAMREAINSSVAMGVDDVSAFEGIRRQWALNADAGDGANQKIVKSASAIAAAYDMVDFTELIQEVNEISKELKITDDEAVAMTNSLLKGGFPPEQLDIISEYGNQMKRAGYEAKEIQAIMSAGVETGTWNIDNLLDGVKEGRIKMAEYARGYPDAISDMLGDLKLSSKVFDGWAKDVAKGGEAGSEALREVSKYINTIKDPALQNEMGVAVFGTKWEDQGVNLTNSIINAENHMKSLSDMQSQLKTDVNSIEEDPAVKLAQAFKDLNTSLQPLYKDVANFVTKIADWVSANPQLAATFVKIAVGVGILAVAIGGALAVVTAAVAGLASLWSSYNIIKGGGEWLSGKILNRTNGLGGRATRNQDGTYTNRRGRVIGSNQSTMSQSIFDQLRRGMGLGRNTNPSPTTRRRGEDPWETLRRESSAELLQNPFDDDGGLERAASELMTAANELQRAARMLSGNPGGGNDRRGRRGRGGNSPADDLSRQTRRSTRSAGGAGNNPADTLSRRTRNNAGGGKWYNKLGKLGKAGGIAGLALGGFSLAGSLSDGDYRSASGTGGAMAGGAAGAALGATLGSVVPGIGTAIGGVAGGIIGSIGGSSLGTKLYDGVKSFDWSGLKSIASNVGQAVSNTWDSLKSTTSTAWDGIKSGVSSSFTGTKNFVSTTASSIGSGLSSTWNTAKSATSTAWTGIKTSASNAISGAKTAVSGTASTLKTGLSTTWDSTKTLASTTWNNIKSEMTTKSDAAKTSVSTAFSTMKTNLSSTWDGLKSTASSAWSSITSSITSSVSSAVSSATSMLGGLKTAVSGAASNVWNKVTGAASKAKNFVMGSHSTGLGRVPFDGYVAELHKNEAVLTANQANALRSAGMLRGDGAAPQLNMSQSMSDVSGYSPLEANPGSLTTASTTNNNGNIRATVTINVDGAKEPQQVAINVKDVFEDWIGSLGTVFPAAMEG